MPLIVVIETKNGISIMLEGHCECGCIKFIVDGDINQLSHCHCSQCRRLHGAAYDTFARVASVQFRYLSGADVLKEYASSSDLKRIFCGACGSNIMVTANYEPNYLYLAMGVIDENPITPEAYHIFVDSKAPWHTITDGAPQFDKFEPDQE